MVSGRPYRTKIKETYTEAIVVLSYKRLIGAEIDIRLVCNGATTSFIRWFIRHAKVPGIDNGGAADDLNDYTGLDALDMYSSLPTLVGEFTTQSEIPCGTLGTGCGDCCPWQMGMSIAPRHLPPEIAP